MVNKVHHWRHKVSGIQRVTIFKWWKQVLCISISFFALKWTKKVEKMLKKVSISFWVRAAPKSWSKYTTNMSSFSSILHFGMSDADPAYLCISVFLFCSKTRHVSGIQLINFPFEYQTCVWHSIDKFPIWIPGTMSGMYSDQSRFGRPAWRS